MAPNGSPDGNLTKELLEKQIALLKDSLEKQIISVKDYLEKHLGNVKATLETRIDALDKQLKSAQSHIQRYIGLVVAVMLALIAIIGGTLWQVVALSREVGDAKTALTKQIGDVQTALAKSESGLTATVQASLDRFEKKLPTAGQPTPPSPIVDLEAPLKLSDLDLIVLRAIFKPKKTLETSAKIGDKVASKPFPQEFADEVPKFKNYQYTFDVSGALLIASPNGRVVAIVEG